MHGRQVLFSSSCPLHPPYYNIRAWLVFPALPLHSVPAAGKVALVASYSLLLFLFSVYRRLVLPIPPSTPYTQLHSGFLTSRRFVVSNFPQTAD